MLLGVKSALVGILAALSIAVVACGSDDVANESGDDGSTKGLKSAKLPIDAADGEATFYGATGGGNCGFDKTPNDLDVAALQFPEQRPFSLSAIAGLFIGHVTTMVGSLNSFRYFFIASFFEEQFLHFGECEHFPDVRADDVGKLLVKRTGNLSTGHCRTLVPVQKQRRVFIKWFA